MPLRWQASYARRCSTPPGPTASPRPLCCRARKRRAAPRAGSAARAQRSENRLDGHVVDAWYALFALMGLPLVPLLAGVLLLLAVAGASLVVLISAVDRMAGEQLTDGP